MLGIKSNAKREKLKGLISDCHRYKADLIVNRDKYPENYYNKKLSEYDGFVKNKQIEIASIDKNNRVFKQIFGLALIIAFMSMVFFVKPTYLGFVTFDNDSYVNEEMGFVVNDSINISSDYLLEGEKDFVYLNGEVNEEVEELNLTNETTNGIEEVSTSIKPSLDIEIEYINEEIGIDFNNVSFTNLTIVNITQLNVSITNITIENLSSINVTLDNVSFENVTVKNITIINVSLENVSVELIEEFVPNSKQLIPSGINIFPFSTLQKKVFLKKWMKILKLLRKNVKF